MTPVPETLLDASATTTTIPTATGFDVGFFVSGFFAFVATSLSLYLICQHFANYTRPEHQRHIVRILCMVPVYSMCGWMTYGFFEAGVYLDLVRSLFEAWVIYEFFSLFLAYLGPSEREQQRSVGNKPAGPIPFPLCCWQYSPDGPYFLRDLKATVIQYVIIRPLTMTAAIILQIKGLLHADGLSPKYGNFWLVGINMISVTVALYGLIVLYLVVGREIADYKPITKFLSVKFVVFLTFWQSIAIGILAYFGCIPSSQYWSQEHTASQVQSLLICCEMMCAAVWHMSNDCFGYAEFVQNAEDSVYTSLPCKQELSFFGAVRDAFQPTDALSEMGLAIQHAITRAFLWWYKREPVAPSEDLCLSSRLPAGDRQSSRVRTTPSSEMLVEHSDLLPDS